MNREENDTQGALGKLASLGSAGFAAGLVLAVFVIGGHYLDGALGSEPVLTVCGIAFGLAGCFYTLLRSFKRGA